MLIEGEVSRTCLSTPASITMLRTGACWMMRLPFQGVTAKRSARRWRSESSDPWIPIRNSSGFIVLVRAVGSLALSDRQLTAFVRIPKMGAWLLGGRRTVVSTFDLGLRSVEWTSSHGSSLDLLLAC